MKQRQGAATYKIEEAAKLLGIGRNLAYEQARTTGALGVPVLRLGKNRMVVPKKPLDDLLGIAPERA